MSTEPTTTQQAPPAWGDPQPPAPKWSGRKTLVAAAVAIAIAAIGAVAIYAGTSSNAGNQQGFGGPGGGMGRMGGFGGQTGAMSVMRDALHGDFTVSENGSYVTERMQNGQVTALSATSITVKSTDGYTQTYAIDSSTQKANNLATGTNVMVLAKVSGNSATATSITDSNSFQGQGGMPGGGRGMNGGQQGGMPAFPGQGQRQGA
ncbi:hypothetical protein HFP15_20875 [Amycolatopsis sp. K13G38]|uniref:DUF5666 domain-containing protein n=1 Tax=Amycolatopsis acididurans TaxID=2724524 RepID=A0ABX1J6I0_9PSEU|nr:VCBS domain-containing protein [Amycolatopsis acididurans]NKQ55343.1 hypothetical protein [Amycolatopsis acididurans]